MSKVDLLLYNSFNHSPEALGYKVGDVFQYVNKDHVFCLGTVDSKFNIQINKEELFFNASQLKYLVISNPVQVHHRLSTI